MPEETSSEEIVLKGIAVSPGIAHGRAFTFSQNDLDVPCYDIKEEAIKEELARFDRAILSTRLEITEVRDKIAESLGEDEARIFDAHLLVLEDNALLEEVTEELRLTRKNIEFCYDNVSRRYISFFESMDDDYLRERVTDIRDVSRRMLLNLTGNEKVSFGDIAAESIIVSDNISPSDAADIDRGKLLGFVTDSGGQTSHAVIMARSIGIPAIVGTHDATARIKSGDTILVDGHEGLIYVNPTESRLFSYGQLASERKKRIEVIKRVLPEPSESKDGIPISLMANVEFAGDMGLVREMNADGVGLFRTEGIFLRHHGYPSEDVQYAEYKAVADAAADSPVIIRTLDIGGDKVIEQNRHREENSFMGFRAIRFCLENTKVFKTHLRAILRASADHGNVKIMYPMISGVVELNRASAILEEVKADMTREGVAFDRKIQVGTMIEVPSAAVTVDLLAQHSDFFSIGTNDLIQYLMAVDRLDDRVAHLYQPAHPAVLRTLKQIIDGAKNAGIPVGVCGELAGDPVFAGLLLGMGADSLSMTANILPEVKYFIRKLESDLASGLVDDVMKLGDSTSVIEVLDDFRENTLGAIV